MNTPKTRAELAATICREVAELPDRNSPETWAEAMLVTADELRAIVLDALAAAPVAVPQAQRAPVEADPARDCETCAHQRPAPVHCVRENCHGRIDWAPQVQAPAQGVTDGKIAQLAADIWVCACAGPGDDIESRIIRIEECLRAALASQPAAQPLSDEQIDALMPALPAPAVASKPIMKADSNRSAERGDFYQDGETPDYFTAEQLKEFSRQHIRASLASQPAAQPAPGLSPLQEPKYTVNGESIVNRASGEAIPADEPVFILRARDVHAMYTLRDYLFRLPWGTEHRKAVEARTLDFFNFKAANLGRMKEPDTELGTPAATEGEQ